MGKLFNPDSPVMQGLSKIADLVVLNILCLICCIPIVTIGVAVTALYDAAGRLLRDEGGVYKAFFHALRSNFKQSTILWLILLAVGALLIPAMIFYSNAKLQIFFFIMVLLAFLWCAVTAWVFPLQSRFVNPVKQTLKNALLCALGYLPRTILCVAFNMLPWILAILFPVFFLQSSVVFVLIWFSLAAYFNLQILKKPFRTLIGEEDPDVVPEESTEE